MATPVITDIVNNQGYKADGVQYSLDPKTNRFELASSLASTNPVANVTPPTVISNQTKKDQVTSMGSSLDSLAQRGIQSNGTTATYANGTVYQQPNTTEQPEVKQEMIREVTYTGADGVERNSETGMPAKIPQGAMFDNQGGFIDSKGKKYNAPAGDTSSLDKQSMDVADEIKSRADKETATMIDIIKSKMGRLITQQEESNKSVNAKTQNSLLQGGISGSQYSSAQFDQQGSDSLVSAQVNYGIQKVADLVSQEQALIAEAEAARYTKNYPDLEKKLALIADKKKETQAEAKKISDMLSKETEKKNEDKIASTKSTAISDIYQTGITDVLGIMNALKVKGLSLTTKEVKDTLAEIVPAGLDDLVKTLRNNGAPQDVIQKVLSSGDMNEAYKNAGTYGAGGTGIIGEYNYYKAQALAAGQNPIDFNTYQTEDANRKAVSIGGGTAPTSYKEWELAGSPGTYAQWLKDNNVKAPTVAQQTVAEYAARLEQAIPTIESQEQKIKNMGLVSFEAQIKLPAALQSADIQQYMQAARNFINAKLRRESGAVISPSEFTDARKQYLPQPGDTDATLLLKKNNRDLVFASLKKAAGNAYESVNDLIGTPNTLIKTEEDANKSLQGYIQANPDKKSNISHQIQIMEKTLGRPINTMEFLEAFPEYKSFSQVGGDTNLATNVEIPQSSRLSSVNNNPGNLKFAGQAGAIKGEGGFAKFATAMDGLKALMNQIKLDIGRGHTLASFIKKFAPPSENDTNLYINQIAQATSSKPTTKLAEIDINALLKAIANKESGTKIS